MSKKKKTTSSSDAVWEVAEDEGVLACAELESKVGAGRIPLGTTKEEVGERVDSQKAYDDAQKRGGLMCVEPVLPAPAARKEVANRPKYRSGERWLKRIQMSENVGSAIEFVKGIYQDQEKKYMVTFFDHVRMEEVHVPSYPTIQQRLDAARFLMQRGIPLPAAQVPQNLPDGIKGVILVTREEDPPV